MVGWMRRKTTRRGRRRRQRAGVRPFREKRVFWGGKGEMARRLGNPGSGAPSPPRSGAVPDARGRGGALIRLTHEASLLGHQLTEAGLGRDGAQEVSHCPAAEPVAWVLQSPSLLLPRRSPPPLFPGFSEQHPAFCSPLRRLISSAVPPSPARLTKQHPSPPSEALARLAGAPHPAAQHPPVCPGSVRSGACVSADLVQKHRWPFCTTQCPSYFLISKWAVN